MILKFVDTGCLPMWCPACQADVAAELSHDSRHFRCARCSLELGIAKGALGAALPAATQPSDAERNARELLAKWNAQNLLAPAAAIRPAPEPVAIPLASEETLPASDRKDSARESCPLRKPRRTAGEGRRPSSAQLPDISPLPTASRRPSWGGTLGQMCAYFGIGLITCGTSVVLWGYFGGPANFAPTGWLITTLGQMFLFLGVVTLISHGLEQSAAESAARMEALGQRLLRIELLQRRQFSLAPSRRRSKPQPDRPDDIPAQAA